MKNIFNPFLPLAEYIADGEPHVFGDRVYLFGSHDKEKGKVYCEIDDYVAYSAPVDDLSAWRCDGVIYDKDSHPDLGGRKFYAPDVVQGNDGRFYLYYCLDGFDSPIHVAVCDTPTGKYKYLGYVREQDGTPMRRFITGDPAVINDGGTIRLYYGWALSMVASGAHGNADRPAEVAQAAPSLTSVETALFHRTAEEVKNSEGGTLMGAATCTLKDDMLTVATPPVRIVPGQFFSKGTSFEGHAFYEASSIRKIKDTYYFIYSSENSHELCYATSKYPDKEFTYRGILVSIGDVGLNGRQEKDRVNMTGNNHGSIENINGKWYIFYHRQTHASTFSRQACAERLELLPDGSFMQAEVTSCGLNDGPLTAQGEFPAVIACNISDGAMPHITNRACEQNIPCVWNEGDERYIKGIRDGVTVGFKYFEWNGPRRLTVKYRGNGNGVFAVLINGVKVAQIPVTAAESRCESHADINLNGKSFLQLKYSGDGETQLLSIKFD